MFIINNDVKNDINKDGIKYLMQYSNMYDKKLRAKDFKYVRSSTISVKKNNLKNQNNFNKKDDEYILLKSNILSNFAPKEE